MEAKKVLFIEGEPQTSNGNLRQGFEQLLAKLLPGKLPRIRLGGGKKQVADQYLNNRFEGAPFLLFDLDAPEEKKDEDLEKHGLSAYRESVFYMVQEMESWFLSQPDVLDTFYGGTTTGKKVSEIMTKRFSAEIANPKEELKRITQKLNKGKEYQEIRHAVELLKRLDATKLENDFPDFKRLIDKLK
jgi:hypothetical protein